MSDLSLKRNMALLMARLQDWRKIVFLDDDIGTTAEEGVQRAALADDAVSRLSAALDTHQIAGLACREFPDNSVVCHARRLAGLAQGSFVSGAALGVNCTDQPLPLFPNQYNEDWFFFSRRAAARDIAYVGDAIQKAYDPFDNPERARQEEFGDLLAEGLFTLFEKQPEEMEHRSRLAAADNRYWNQYIPARREMIRQTAAYIEPASNDHACGGGWPTAALRSLEAAEEQLGTITSELCVEYLATWADDLAEWERATQRIHAVGSTANAIDFLQLRDWRLVGAIPA